MRPAWFGRWLVAVLATVAPPALAAGLPALKLDQTMTTVSGLSSGGYMAVQLHVAYSSVFTRGVGIVAAGPYYCAEGQLKHATGRCLDGESTIPVESLQSLARQWAALGWIDPLATLRESRVYLFSGTRDSAVRPAVSHALQRWYAAFVPTAQLRHRNDVPAEHSMVTDDFGSPCHRKGMPYINDCDLDLAGEMLSHLYGPLAPRNNGSLQGRFVEFDQGEFIAKGRGMGPKGWLFVPRDCAQGAQCRLHVVLHGCGQSVQDIGNVYVRRTGYNRWADSNRIVVLYPQTSPEALNSCWDWWGYNGADYAQRSGAQARAIVAMVERLSRH